MPRRKHPVEPKAYYFDSSKTTAIFKATYVLSSVVVIFLDFEFEIWSVLRLELDFLAD